MLGKKAAKYHDKNREDLSKKAKNRYRNLSKKEKEAKREYQRDGYHINITLSKKLKQYQRDYYDSKKIKK